jgi:hypothetical protein
MGVCLTSLDFFCGMPRSGVLIQAGARLEVSPIIVSSAVADTWVARCNCAAALYFILEQSVITSRTAQTMAAASEHNGLSHVRVYGALPERVAERPGCPKCGSLI